MVYYLKPNIPPPTTTSNVWTFGMHGYAFGSSMIDESYIYTHTKMSSIGYFTRGEEKIKQNKEIVGDRHAKYL